MLHFPYVNLPECIPRKQVAVARAPSPLPRYHNLAYPFEAGVWALVLASLVLVVLASSLNKLATDKVCSKTAQNNAYIFVGIFFPLQKFDLFSSSWEALSILFVEGKRIYLMGGSLVHQRVLNTSWMLACFLLVASYQV